MAIQIASYNLDAISYLPLFPSPKGQSYHIEVMNPNQGLINLRTDPTDPNTQIQLLPGESKSFETTRNGTPYNAGTPLIYGIMGAGTGSIKLIAH